MSSPKRKAGAQSHARSAQKKAARKPVHKTGSAAQDDELRRVATLRACGAWSLHEALIDADWRNEGRGFTLVVARRSPAGRIAGAVFFVDLGCFGVKSAFAALLSGEEEYRTRLLGRFQEDGPLESIDANLAAKIVRDAVAYAAKLGIEPDPDIRDASLVMGDLDPDACEEAVPLGGRDGKPFCIVGPHDDPGIIDRLEARLGPDGFRFIAGRL